MSDQFYKTDKIYDWMQITGQYTRQARKRWIENDSSDSDSKHNTATREKNLYIA